MKAVVCTRYGPPEVLRVAEVDRPEPRRNEVRVRIFATSVTASDCIVRKFDVPWRLRLPMAVALGVRKPRNPILGLVMAGEVESTAENVKRFKTGDQVFGFTEYRMGCYAQYVCLAETAKMAAKPTNLTYEEAAAVPYGGLLALCFFRKAQVQPGQRVLIYGASGSVGTAAVQLARYFGADVTGVCSTANVEMVESIGASTVIDYTKEDFTTRPERYDLVFNAVGKRKARLRCDGALTPGGKHITVDDGLAKLHIEDLVLLKELVEAGTFKPVIDRTYGLEQMVEAHLYVDMGHKKGNVVISVGNDRPDP
jgi:NADPH:quinone reductase-like Zn-dependent oxidoreductase